MTGSVQKSMKVSQEVSVALPLIVPGLHFAKMDFVMLPLGDVSRKVEYVVRASIVVPTYFFAAMIQIQVKKSASEHHH